MEAILCTAKISLIVPPRVYKLSVPHYLKNLNEDCAKARFCVWFIELFTTRTVNMLSK